MPVYHDNVPINRIPSRHRPDSTGQCNDCDPLQRNMSRHSHDCSPTRRSQPYLPNGTGRTLLSGVIGRPSRPSRLCYKPSRLRPDNDMTFSISPNSNPTFSFSVSKRCRDSIGSHKRGINCMIAIQLYMYIRITNQNVHGCDGTAFTFIAW